MTHHLLTHRAPINPFYLGNNTTYQAWRKHKLANYPIKLAQLIVSISNPFALMETELTALKACCQHANMVIYRTPPALSIDKKVPHAIATQMGLNDVDRHLCVDPDGLTSLQTGGQKIKQEYVPYTNHPLNWHTDGYYNPPSQQIQSMLLHCARTAEQGGENTLIDHEIVYILLRDRNPHYIEALMQTDAMTIPANISNGKMIRPAETGPVFSISHAGLHMRYTARTTFVEWKQQPLLLEAIAYLSQLINSDSPYVFHYLLQPGEGIICNNVLHKRTAFKNGTEPKHQRLIYRGRFYDRIFT